jgi:molybdopterin-guanine dinucleotide biosynthesis protein A
VLEALEHGVIDAKVAAVASDLNEIVRHDASQKTTRMLAEPRPGYASCIMHASRATMVAGIFVGGRGTRMGGRPKGLLEASPGVTLVRRFQDLFGGLGIGCVLVGAGADYANEGLPDVPDQPPGGPLGGLLALLGHAGDRTSIAVACDMPFVSAALLERLVDAPPCAALAPRRNDRWEPFLARYDSRIVRPLVEAHAHAGKRRLQDLLDAIPAAELHLSAAEASELDDWDAPDDIVRPRGLG